MYGYRSPRASTIFHRNGQWEDAGVHEVTGNAVVDATVRARRGGLHMVRTNNLQTGDAL